METYAIIRIFKVIKYLFYLGLCVGCYFFVKETWNKYRSQATSFIFTTKKVSSLESPSVVICFEPMGKKSFFNAYDLLPTAFVTYSGYSTNSTKEYSKPWYEIYQEVSFKIGIDFNITIDIQDGKKTLELSNPTVNKNESEHVDVQEIYTLWDGLCTKIKIKEPLSHMYGDYITLGFNKDMKESDIPNIKLYFTSENNSGDHHSLKHS